jgi:ferredoxin-NADP reductase
MYGANTEDIELAPEHPFLYKPGQYVEMTLPHKGSDARGARRYFTLASSPTEDTLRLGVRYYENGSSFKSSLHNPDSTFMSFGQVGGDFTLPKSKDAKLAFIAGGIGVTPFRSMVKYLADTNDARPAIMLYGERSIEDIAYREIFEEAQSKIGLVVRYVLGSMPQQLSSNEIVGMINRDLIAREIPDYASRTFYISGPQSMVKGVKKELRSMGVSRRNIKTDYFFGYA